MQKLTQKEKDYMLKWWDRYSHTEDGTPLSKTQTFKVFANKFDLSYHTIKKAYYEEIIAKR